MSYTDTRIYEYTKAEAGALFSVHRNVASGKLDSDKHLALIDMGLGVEGKRHSGQTTNVPSVEHTSVVLLWLHSVIIFL
jgi:hypothetical protein